MKGSNSKGPSNNGALRVMAYIAFVVIALLILVNNLFPLMEIVITGPITNILETVKNVLILIILGIMAFKFTIGCAKWVKIIYWISLVIFITGTVILWAK